MATQNHASLGGYLCDLQVAYVAAMRANSEAGKVAFYRDCAAIVTAMRSRFRCSDPVPGNSSETISNMKHALESAVYAAQAKGQDCQNYAEVVIGRCAGVLKLELQPSSAVF